MTDNYKSFTDTGLAETLRTAVADLAELLKECKERNMSVTILAHPYDPRLQWYQSTCTPTHQITQHDAPVVASIVRTKQETF